MWAKLESVGMSGVVCLTVEGSWVRAIWQGLARHWLPARRALLYRDAWEVLHGETLPGELVYDWPAERTAESLAAQIAEQIRRAPRAGGVTNYVLEVGQRGVDSPALTSGVAEANTLQTVTEFLTTHDPGAAGRVVRVLLLGQLMATVKRSYGWTVE